MTSLKENDHFQYCIIFIFIAAVPSTLWGSNNLLIWWFMIIRYFNGQVLRTWLHKHKLRQTCHYHSWSYFSYLYNEDFVLFLKLHRTLIPGNSSTMEVPGLRTGDTEVSSHLPELTPLVIDEAGASSVLSQTLSSHWAAPRG